MRLIISLTTIPSRFGMIAETLESLLAQTADVAEIRLNVPHEYARFPEYNGHLPDVPQGITIARPETDFGPATKVLPVAKEYRDDPEAVILFCDDDRVFAPDWAAGFVADHKDNPDKAICISGFHLVDLGIHIPPSTVFQPRAEFRKRTWDMEYRWKRIKQQIRHRSLIAVRNKPPRRLVTKGGHVDVFEGVGGVLVRPSFFDDRAFDIPPEGRPVDDIWLSGMLALKGIPIWSPADRYMPLVTEADRQDALYRANFDGKKRHELNVACAQVLQRDHGVWT